MNQKVLMQKIVMSLKQKENVFISSKKKLLEHVLTC